MTVITILKSKDALISKNIASLTMGFAERVKGMQTKQVAINDEFLLKRTADKVCGLRSLFTS
jgi:hypothetical protein